MKIIFLLPVIIMLTGCNSQKELENREYVMAMGIEKEENYDITLSVAKLGGTEEEKSGEYIVEGKGKTIEDALKDANTKTRGDIYLGHNKVIIFSENYKDFGDFINYANKNIELNRDIITVKSKSPKEAVEAKTNDISASQYIYDYYENIKKIDMDKLMDMYNNNESIILPDILIMDNNIIIKST